MIDPGQTLEDEMVIIPPGVLFTLALLLVNRYTMMSKKNSKRHRSSTLGLQINQANSTYVESGLRS